ncbi:multidrug transporter [Phenylobacterium sp. Root77]|uniref:DMT family transporter n=1 Tax=unclassified Phenylobacterium TaxID=2640670 RepID=UPI0006F3769E|nr:MULTISPECIES: SMR family transporter [unclassified Phenylobacterium]KQW66515.1 multidrug transporter [Phenylobacterium sp. Root1277]KQW89020.1 multidrug transporter [Phenylobacterium sp. Root1290]KRC42125.1 multidrug transporter [Phenylobacterium sp. Root77]
MAWILLFVAGLLEVVWAFSMKQSHGFTKLVPTVITIGTMVASFALLSVSMKTLPLGTAYTIWTGIGAVGAFVVGVAVLGEHISAVRVLAAVMIVGGLVLMKLSSSH